jgi:hypothetical protein
MTPAATAGTDMAERMSRRLNVALYASRLTRPWHKVAIRVAASRVLAISILVITFALYG